MESSCVCTKPVPGMASAHIQKQRFRRDFSIGAKPRRFHLESGTSLNIGEVRRQSLSACVCTKPIPNMASAHIQKQRFWRDFSIGAKPRRFHLESGMSLNIGEVRRQSFSADLHRSKPLILVVHFNLHFHCFQG